MHVVNMRADLLEKSDGGGGMKQRAKEREDAVVQ